LVEHRRGTLESQEATPIVVGDTMYISTSTGPKYVFALNAKDGTVKWKYEPELPQDVFATVCCGLDSRGAAYANGKVFVTRLDAKMVALDAMTGKELWNVTVADYKVGHAITSPPVVYKDLVVTVMPVVSTACAAPCRRTGRTPATWSGRRTPSLGRGSPETRPGRVTR
jgi:glucose dehydrogenase